MEQCKKYKYSKFNQTHKFPTYKKLKDPENIANGVINLFTAVMEKLNLNEVRKEKAISFVNDIFA